MKILITTPAGIIGRKILPELLAPEFSVRIISRNPGGLPADISEQVEVIRGSTADANLLREALEGVEALFWCVPRIAPGKNELRSHYEQFARAASLAIREVGTPRVVAISTASASSDLRATEDILNDCGAAIRHLRCGWLMENLLPQAKSFYHDGIISYPIRGDIAIPMIAAADVADLALKYLVRRHWSGIGSIPVHGSARLTLEEAAAEIERILEHPLRYEEASREENLRSAVEGLPDFAEEMAGAESGRLAAARTFAAWVRSELLPVILQGSRPIGGEKEVATQAAA